MPIGAEAEGVDVDTDVAGGDGSGDLCTTGHKLHLQAAVFGEGERAEVGPGGAIAAHGITAATGQENPCAKLMEEVGLDTREGLLFEEVDDEIGVASAPPYPTLDVGRAAVEAVGEGSLGGKGRGLAFIDRLVKQHPELNDDEHMNVMIPKTVVLCTDVFERFMDQNNLYPLALSDADDDTILDAFRRAQFPEDMRADCEAFINATHSPIAVRSSSLLEDSHYQPFAGIYATYMIPYLEDRAEMLRMLADAIKGVYASVYYKDSKAYMTATRNVIDQEKMAVILQEVVGTQYGDRYYPAISGVGRSLNHYPLGEERAEEGIVNLALGLGKYIVDGGMTLRVCPSHPKKVLQMSEMKLALRETQTKFYALDLKNYGENFSIDDGFNLLNLEVKQAEKDGALQYIASTYNAADEAIYPGLYPG